MRTISEDSLFTMVLVFLSHSTGTLYFFNWSLLRSYRSRMNLAPMLGSGSHPANKE